MILRLAAEVLKDALFPIALHVIPVVDLSMTNGVVELRTVRKFEERKNL